MAKNILIITGEPSGDAHAGELVRELKAMLPDVSFWGIGGDRMEQQGVELIEHVRNLSIVGILEALKNLHKIRKQYKKVIVAIREKKPELAILVDYPGFNLRLASFLHSKNIPVVYYIIPQVWAWGRGRIKALKKSVDKALVLFDFEEILLKKAGMDCEFVGHPLIDKAPLPSPPGEKPQSGDSALSIALLPGSRKSEISNMLPVMLDAAEKIREVRRNVRFVVAENLNVDKNLYDSALEGHEELAVSRLSDNTFKCLEQSDFAMVTSGTATLEAAIMEKPMIITYRALLLNTVIFRAIVKIPFIGLANIIAGEKIVPELLQKDATPDKLARTALDVLDDPRLMELTKDKLRKVRFSLGKKGASRRAAEAVKRFLEDLDGDI